MASPAVIVGLPSASLFRFPPGQDPIFIPPPQPGTIAAAPPFSIPDHIYLSVLDVRVPITIATIYAITAKLLNRYNRSTGRRPWAISKTRPFFAFVVLHNVFLAVYSAWTFWGMFGTLRRGIVNPYTSAVDSTTGSIDTGGWAATVDSFCRLNGPPGLGNGLFFNDATGQWQSQSSAVPLLGSPDRTQPGRVWNEGLAFYGWIFYLSKFYEVLDTFIILAKGKYSSTLQTYHHAGAMMCMWAGMRYMSAPIWVFAFVNSGIHALMYTYYTITAFSIRVPTAIKRTLTTMQIAQFVVGASYAMVHSFVSYTVPVVDGPARASASSLSGKAANATAAIGQSFGAGYATKTVPCIATSGETFAIWLNVLYLAPLTYLFVSFFIASYLRRSNAESARAARLGKKEDGQVSGAASHLNGNVTLADTIVSTANAAAAAEALVRRRLSNVSNLAEKAGWDAARGLEKEVYGESQEEAIDETLTVPAQGRAKRSDGRSRRRAA